MFSTNNYRAEVKRGWPMDGSLDRVETVYKNGSVVASLQNGDWVSKRSDGTVGLAVTAKSAAAGLVVAGNADSASSAYTGKATVLWGNFIAEVQYGSANSAVSSTTTAAATGTPADASSWAPGSPLTVSNGQLTLGVVGTDPIVGYVLDVVVGSGTTNSYLTVKIN